MRTRVLSTLTFLAASGSMACSGERIQLDPPSNKTGGKSGSAGRAGSAGTAARAGRNSAGNATSSGGVDGSSGKSTTSSGGRTTSAGGATTVSSGGASSTGGSASSSGGTTNAGGKATTGGTTNSGGSAVTGGATNTGGSTASGGAANTGGTKATGGTNTGGGKATGGTNTGGGKATGGSSSTGGTATGGSSTGGAATGGSSVVQPPPITGGSSGWVSRYWDCCKPACGWTANVSSGNPAESCDQSNQALGDVNATSSCDGGNAYMCWNMAPWSVSDTLAYGFVAASQGNYVCGRCFQIQFTGTGHSGNSAGVQALSGKTMIVQVTNNGGVASDQFDLLIPGGGMGVNQTACPNQLGVSASDLGSQYGGLLTSCSMDVACTRTKCQTVFAGKPDLLAGCEWFLTWYVGADNPNVVFKQIACPAEITGKSGLSG